MPPDQIRPGSSGRRCRSRRAERSHGRLSLQCAAISRQVVTRGETRAQCLSGEIDAIIISGKIITGALGGGLGVLVMERFIMSDRQSPPPHSSDLRPGTGTGSDLISKTNIASGQTFLQLITLCIWTSESSLPS